MTKIRLESLDDFSPLEGFRAKLIHTEKMTIAHWTIDAGGELPTHSHPEEQVANVMEGEFELTVDGETELLSAGDVVVIPSDAPHSGRAISDCKIIDVWHPCREDYK